MIKLPTDYLNYRCSAPTTCTHPYRLLRLSCQHRASSLNTQLADWYITRFTYVQPQLCPFLQMWRFNSSDSHLSTKIQHSVSGLQDWQITSITGLQPQQLAHFLETLWVFYVSDSKLRSQTVRLPELQLHTPIFTVTWGLFRSDSASSTKIHQSWSRLSIETKHSDTKLNTE